MPDAPQPTPHAALAALSAAQHGAVTRRQARSAGLTRHQIERLVRSGAYEALTKLVLRDAGAPRSAMSEAWAALLDLGPTSAICLSSSIASFEVPGHQLAPPHVVVPRPRRSGLVEPARLHTSVLLPPEHLTVVHGLQVVTPERTLLDMAAHLDAPKLERLTDKLWARGLILPSRALQLVTDLAPGRTGAATLRRILAARHDDDMAPESGTESRFCQLLEQDGQEPMRRQVWVGDDRPIGRVDFLDEPALLIVEVQSTLFHGSLTDRQRDAERHARLRSAGWDVMEVWADRIWREGAGVAAEVRQRRLAGRRRRRDAA